MNIEEARKAAKEWLREHNGEYLIRSCWNCNPAHEHLKDADYVFVCPWCGHWYYKGVDITEGDGDDQI